MKLLNNLAVAAVLGSNAVSADSRSISLEQFSATNHVDIMVEHGVAIISGHVGSWYQSVEAENAAEKIEGVLFVRNRVKVD